MRWKGRRRSAHVEDRRATGPRRGIRLGAGGLIAVLAISAVIWWMGGDPTPLLQSTLQNSGSASAPSGATTPNPQEEELVEFVSVVLADTEDTWSQLLAAEGKRYEPPKLVLFRGAVESACGHATAAVGPFYCPGDRQVYIDLMFFDELDRRFGAPGDFAQAYVIAHEVGHHLQTLLGYSDQVRRAKRGRSEAERNVLSVRQELQADCFAGVWAHHAHRQRQLLEAGDVEEGLAAATAIGDDTLQRRAGGRVAPETWTHGSSEMRVRWFRTGLSGGEIAQCNTYETRTL